MEVLVGLFVSFSLLILAESIMFPTGGKFVAPWCCSKICPVLIYFKNAACPVDDESGTRIGCFCEL
jgi:hypothetical protein